MGSDIPHLSLQVSAIRSGSEMGPVSMRLTPKHETKTLGSTSRMKAEFGAWRVSYRAKEATKGRAKSCTNKGMSGTQSAKAWG